MKKAMILALVILFGCNQQPVKEYKYTIWVGSPAFGVGYHTDTFNIDNGIIKYEDSFGRDKMHPMGSVYEIELNE
jgi:hypothetical protein